MHFFELFSYLNTKDLVKQVGEKLRTIKRRFNFIQIDDFENSACADKSGMENYYPRKVVEAFYFGSIFFANKSSFFLRSKKELGMLIHYSSPLRSFTY